MSASSLVVYTKSDGRLTIDGLRLFRDMERRLRDAESKLEAIAAITAPSGGVTIDAQARTAINDILSAAG